MLKKIGFGHSPAAIALALPLMFLTGGQARAELLGDAIKPFASVSETYDSNVFRVRDKEQLKALVRDDQMSDLITVTTVGSAFHYGLSSLESNLLLKRDFIHYAHYSSQSISRDEITGDTSVRILDAVKLKVDGGYLKEPQPRADFRSPGLNVMTTLQYGLLVGYQMKSGLELEAGYRRIGVDYSLKEFQPNEYDVDRYTGTVSYRLSPEAKVYASYQRENMAYRQGISVDNAAVKNDNTGDSVRIGMEKIISPKTAVSGYLGYLDRRHDAAAGRNFSGPIGKAEVRYGLTSKVGVVVDGERQLYEETYPGQNYSVNTSVGAGLTYQVTQKVKASVMNRATWKGFQNVPGTLTPKRHDLVNVVGAGIDWTPRDRVTVSLGYQYGHRNSNDSSFKYSSHAVTVGVAYKF